MRILSDTNTNNWDRNKRYICLCRESRIIPVNNQRWLPILAVYDNGRWCEYYDRYRESYTIKDVSGDFVIELSNEDFL